jgi:hypothetical protein
MLLLGAAKLRKMLGGRIFALTMWLTTLPVALYAQQTKPSLGIAGAGTDSGKTVSIQVDSGYVQQFLRIDSLNPTTAADVEVRLSPLVGVKQRWVQPRWQCWSNDEQRAKCGKNDPCAKVTIAGLKEAWCRVTAWLPEPDSYVGRIDLIYNDARDSYKLAITRGPDETLQVRGIDNSAEYTTEPALFELATGISSKSLRAVPRVRLVVYELIGPQSVTPSVVLKGLPHAGAEFTVPGNGEIPLTLSMNLPLPGTYKGALELIHGRNRDKYTFNVKRVEAKAPVTIRPIEAARADTSFSGVANLRVILEGTRSVPFALDLPNIASLYRKESDKVNAQALFTSITFKELNPDRDLIAGSSVTLEGRTPKPMRVVITGLEPGEYSGLFTVGTKDLAPQESTFSIYVRRAWWIAGLWIGLGVALSWRLRSWTLKGRPRLAAQRQLSHESADIEGTFREVKDATPAEKRVLQDFSRRVAELFGEWDRGAPTVTAAATDTVVNEISAKLSAFRQWVNLRRRFDTVQTPLPDLADMRQRLAAFGDRFLAPAADATLGADIAQLGTQLTTALSALLVARIQALRADIQGIQATDFGKPYASQLKDGVLPQLDRAEKLATVPDRFNEAVANLEDSRLTYTRILAGALNMQIPMTTPDAVRIPQVEWDSVVTSVRQATEKARMATSADAAADAYAQAFSVYMNRLLAAMDLRLRAAPEKIKKTTLSDDEKRAQNQKIGEARILADQCAAQVANHEFTAAARTFEQLRASVLEIAMKVESGGQDMGPNAAVMASRAIPGAGAGMVLETGPIASTVASIPEPPAGIILSVAEIDKRIRRNENWFALVVGVISILVGVKLLWLPSPTWGDWADYVTAFLWGLGLHQVSGAAMGQFDWGTMLNKWSGAGGGGANAAG